MINDGHYHVLGDIDIYQTKDYFNKLRERFNIDQITILCCYFDGKIDYPLNNLEALAIKKIMAPNVFAYLSLWHNFNEKDTAEGYLKQLEDGLAMGFDGVKMLEGKPDLHKRLGNRRLDDPVYDLMYKRAEELGTHILMHACDPDVFWTDEKYKKYNWYYGDDPKIFRNEIIEDEVEGILKKFPNLNLTMAHFFFMSKKLDKLARLFDTYPNFNVDLCPGGIMCDHFAENPQQAHDFFVKYQDRFTYGTDVYNSIDDVYYGEVYQMVSGLIGDGDETLHLFGHVVKPLKLDAKIREKIEYSNIFSRRPKTPKPVVDRLVHQEIEYILNSKYVLSDKDQANFEMMCKEFGYTK